MAGDERILAGGPVADDGGDYGYATGFGNTHSSEAVAGALPIGRNSPQRPPHGLYAEQLSGTAFTAPRASNRRAWLYRMRPSVRHATSFEPIDAGRLRTAPCPDAVAPIAAQLRWGPWPLPDGGDVDFVDGLITMTTCGDVAQLDGMAAHVFAANASMRQRYFMNGDGELLILPEHNVLRVITEFGILRAGPGEMLVVPRGVKFRVELPDGAARGFVLENYGQLLALPERGPIGANALANERDFLYPAAAYEDVDGDCEFLMKWQGRLFATRLSHSPLDVVAWHGNYAPYKYDLRRFNTIGSISYDHPDPSIFTVMTSPSAVHGTANVDVVIFPERWLVMEDTFRPPWFHTNVMSEFMGLVYGVYDAKPGGFRPGGMSLHNAMLPHGPDAEAFDAASHAELAPEKLSGTLAFMFETRLIQHPTAAAVAAPQRDTGYTDCWVDLRRQFRSDS